MLHIYIYDISRLRVKGRNTCVLIIGFNVQVSFSTYALWPSSLIVRSGLEVPTFATTPQHPAAEGGTVGEKCLGILPKCRLPRYIYESFTCRKVTTWDRRLYFPSEGRRAENFFALKIRRLRPGANPRTWVPKASTLPLDHRSRYFGKYLRILGFSYRASSMLYNKSYQLMRLL